MPELLKQAGEYQELIITLRATSEAALTTISTLPWVHSAVVTANVLTILTANAELALPRVFETLVTNKLELFEIKINKPSLESLFLKLTGRALRD